MPRWFPTPVWKGEDCYIIGGGPSLVDFDWRLLIGKHTIGCNSAYGLGPEICEVCFFGDMTFFDEHEEALASFPGIVATNLFQLGAEGCAPWLYVTQRQARGMDTRKVGWNGNSGAAAVNLALILGTARVFLLGFDMCTDEGRFNWYSTEKGSKSDSVFARFLKGFGYVARDLPLFFPNSQIINITDDSLLDCFPKVSLEQHFGQPVFAGATP